MSRAEFSPPLECFYYESVNVWEYTIGLKALLVVMRE